MSGCVPQLARSLARALVPLGGGGAAATSRRLLASSAAGGGGAGPSGPGAAPSAGAAPSGSEVATASTSGGDKGGERGEWTEVIDEGTGKTYWWNQATGARPSDRAGGARPPAAGVHPPPSPQPALPPRARPLPATSGWCCRPLIAPPPPRSPPAVPHASAHRAAAAAAAAAAGETTDLGAARPAGRFAREAYEGMESPDSEPPFQEGWREPPEPDRTFFYTGVGVILGIVSGWATQFIH
jgi:hypothetical protein